jgi:hypothetical protein
MRTALATMAGFVLVGTTLSGSLASAASASPGSEFSEHVRTCSQTMDFDGMHNPGVMHRGFADWDPSHMC